MWISPVPPSPPAEGCLTVSYAMLTTNWLIKSPGLQRPTQLFTAFVLHSGLGDITGTSSITLGLSLSLVHHPHPIAGAGSDPWGGLPAQSPHCSTELLGCCLCSHPRTLCPQSSVLLQPLIPACGSQERCHLPSTLPYFLPCAVCFW